MATNKMTNSEKLRDEVLGSVKSIISSRGGQCQVNDLIGDYRELVGTPIPFKQLGYSTFISYLQTQPQHFVYQFQNYANQQLVSLKNDKATAHIAKLAKEQRKATRKTRTKQKPARRPQAPPSLPRGYGSINRWKPNPFYSNAPRTRNNQRHETRGLYNPPSNSVNSGRSQVPPRRPEYKLPSPSKPKSPPPSKPKSPPPHNHKPNIPSKCKSPPPPLLGNKPALLPTPMFQVPKVYQKPSCLYYYDGHYSFPRAVRENQAKQFAPYFEVPPRFKKKPETEELTCKQKLEKEAKRRGLSDIVFRSLPCGKKRTYWVCTITIEGLGQVSSYPEEFTLVQLAEEAASKKALEKLEKEDKFKYPVTQDLFESLNRVHKILSDVNGELSWFEYVQKLYQEEYKEQLPQNWPEEVCKYNEMNKIKHGVIVDNPIQDRWTVQLKLQEITPNQSISNGDSSSTKIMQQHLIEPAAPDESSISSNVLYEDIRQQFLGNQDNPIYQEPSMSEEEFLSQNLNMNMDLSSIVGQSDNIKDGEPRGLPGLELPLSSYWDVYVTFIEDFQNINFRLVGENFSNAYEDLVTEMELHYFEAKNLSPVSDPKINHIYAASHEESWCRVRVMSISGSEAMVYFLDHGDQENIEISNLHVLNENFFNLPAQAVCCSLAGLEFGGKDQNSLSLLQSLALGQTLVAQPVSRDDNLSLILFNTLTDDDININERVSEQMDQNFVDPVLPSVGGVVEVYLLHTTSSGDMYVQIETETYKVLQNLLEVARSRTEEILGDKAEIDLTRIYMARFSEGGEWYRAVPRGNVDPEGKALLCRLHNVPPSETLKWTTRACDRLMELIPEDSPMLLKMHVEGVNGAPPFVELFKRIPEKELVSINASLSMDESLFSPDGDSNNNVKKEVILSPTRTRNRIGSSNSITSCGSSSEPSSLTSISEFGLRASSPRFQQSDPIQHMEIPDVGEYFDVYVTYAASPSHFAVQPWKTTHKLTNLMENMQKYYAQGNNFQSNFLPNKEGYYAVKHVDSYWYRSYLTMVNPVIVTGLFVDYGDCFAVSPDLVQPLPSVFHYLPCQAIRARLAGITAANVDWRPEDSFRFKDLVEYRELVSIIQKVERASDGNYVLSLRLIDTSDEKVDVYIDEILLKENRAIKLEE